MTSKKQMQQFATSPETSRVHLELPVFLKCKIYIRLVVWWFCPNVYEQDQKPSKTDFFVLRQPKTFPNDELQATNHHSVVDQF